MRVVATVGYKVLGPDEVIDLASAWSTGSYPCGTVTQQDDELVGWQDTI